VVLQAGRLALGEGVEARLRRVRIACPFSGTDSKLRAASAPRHHSPYNTAGGSRTLYPGPSGEGRRIVPFRRGGPAFDRPALSRTPAEGH
jgi:hypothetical protein